MNFSKKQLLVFSVVVILLISTLTSSTAFSVSMIMQYLNSGNTVVAAGGTNSAQDTTLPADTQPDTYADDTLSTTVVDIINGQPGDNSGSGSSGSGSSGSGSSGNKTDNNTTTKKANTVPSTNDEIVALYKSANAKAKSKAKTATMIYNNTTNYKEVVEAGALSSIAQILMNAFMKENKEAQVHTDDAKTVIPPKNGSCNLKASDIQKATCTDKGTYYFVTILLKPDKNPKNGYGSGSICTILTPDQITEPAAKYKVTVSNLVCEYDGAYTEVKIDKATGNLTEVYTRLPMYLCLSAKWGLISMDNAKLGLQFEERWTIAY